MTLSEAQARLLALNQSFIKTRDAAACLGVTNAHASKILSRLSDHGLIVSVSHSHWALSKQVERLLIPEQLTAPLPSYISLHTALYYHGLVSQIPVVTYAVSLARTQKHTTPFGPVSIHHVQPEFFFGFEVTGRDAVKMATPEKALIDYLYLTPARSNLFKALPEVELPEQFNLSAARKTISKISHANRRALVQRRFDELLKQRS